MKLDQSLLSLVLASSRWKRARKSCMATSNHQNTRNNTTNISEEACRINKKSTVDKVARDGMVARLEVIVTIVV